MSRKVSRYRKRDSDRSGFTYKERELIRDEGFFVGPDEYDSPPPSTRPLGGEGELSDGNVRANPMSYDTPTENDITINLIQAVNGINFVRKTYTGGEVLNSGLVYISGSDSLTIISKNPQITTGLQNDIIIIECVSNQVVISNGNGVSLMNSHYVMDSGAVMTLIYNTGSNVWQETSRGHKFKSIGGF